MKYNMCLDLPFGHKQTLAKTQLKICVMMSILSFFAHLDKATIKPSCCEVHTKSFFFLGDMDDYIRLINVPKM